MSAGCSAQDELVATVKSSQSEPQGDSGVIGEDRSEPDPMVNREMDAGAATEDRLENVPGTGDSNGPAIPGDDPAGDPPRQETPDGEWMVGDPGDDPGAPNRWDPERPEDECGPAGALDAHGFHREWLALDQTCTFPLAWGPLGTDDGRDDGLPGWSLEEQFVLQLMSGRERFLRPGDTCTRQGWYREGPNQATVHLCGETCRYGVTQIEKLIDRGCADPYRSLWSWLVD